MGSLDEVDVVELLRGEFTRGSLVYGSALSGDCDSGSNATERAGCEHFLQVRTVGVGREGSVRWEVFTLVASSMLYTHQSVYMEISALLFVR